jgi:hypothetical protein
MALEWLRRHVPKLDEELRTYLFTSGSIAEIEEAAEATDHSAETSVEDRHPEDQKDIVSREPAGIHGDLGIGKFQRSA